MQTTRLSVVNVLTRARASQRPAATLEAGSVAQPLTTMRLSPVISEHE